MQALSFECEIDQADFTDWMFLIVFYLIEEITLLRKPSAQIHKAFNQYEIADKTNDNLDINVFI